MARSRSFGLSLPAAIVALSALLATAVAQPPSPSSPGGGGGAPSGGGGPPQGGTPGTGSGPAPQQSDSYTVRFCNHTGPTAYSALVFKRGQDWVVKGWWTIASGQCVNAQQTTYGWVYMYAEHGKRVWPNQDNTGSNVVDICVVYPGPFERRNNTAGYTCDRQLLKRFWGYQVQPSASGVFTFDLRD